MNSSTRLSPFQIVYGRAPKNVVDLANIPRNEWVDDDAKVMPKSINIVHDEVKNRLLESNVMNKEVLDRHRRHKKFEEENMIMVFLKKDRFLSGTYKNLKFKKIGLYCILKKIYENTYEVNLPAEYGIS